MFADYLHLQQLLYDGTFSNDGMQVDVPGIHGLLLQEWPHSAAANRIAELIDIVLIAAMAWKWRGPWQVGGRSFSVRWALLVAVTVFVSPFAHIYDTAILALPAVVLVAAYSAPEITHWDRRAIIVTLAALDSGPFLRMLFSQHFQTPGLVLAILMLWRLDSLFSAAAVGEPAEEDLPAAGLSADQVQGKTASARTPTTALSRRRSGRRHLARTTGSGPNAPPRVSNDPRLSNKTSFGRHPRLKSSRMPAE
jgi:hypothetical protein